MEIQVVIKVFINEPNGYSESDVDTCFHGMGEFAGLVKNLIPNKLGNDIKVDAVEVDGIEY